MTALRQSSALDGSQRIVADLGGRRYSLPLTGGVPQIGHRVDVSDWMGINIQCVPQEEIGRRKKAGLPRLEFTFHGLAERAHSYYPATLAHTQSLTAREVLDLFDPLPKGATRTGGPIYRDFVNTGQLTEAGHYTAPGRERFMREWIANGGRVLFVNAALHNESPDFPTIKEGPQACRDYLMQTGPQGVETMRRIARLIARLTPQEQAAVVAVETMNEPAIYGRIEKAEWGDTGLTVQDCRDLFEADQAEIARAALDEGTPDHVLILMPRYGYNARADVLLGLAGRDNSMLDRWLDEFGDRIGISVHKYAGWIPGQYTGEWLANGIADLDQLAHVPQVLTETNTSDFTPAARKTGAHHSGWTLADLCMDTGVAPMFFPAANWGGDPMMHSRHEPDRVLHPDRFFAWYDTLARLLRRDPLDVTLDREVARSPVDPLYIEDNDDNRIRAGLRIVRMGDGAGELVMSGPQAIMAIGGEGDQRVTMNPDEFSWFSGWTGNDTIDATRCPGCIVNLGDGEDTILLGGDSVTVNGRGGGDTFVLGDGGSANIFGFSTANDTIKTNGVPYSIKVEGDVTIRTAGGGVVRFVGQRSSSELSAIKRCIIA